MPLNPRSSRTTCVKREECPFAESPRGAKSATATRGFSTPRPVLMRNQSCPNAAPAITNATAKKNTHRKNGFSTEASLCLLSSTGLDSLAFHHDCLKSKSNVTRTDEPASSDGSVGKRLD